MLFCLNSRHKKSNEINYVLPEFFLNSWMDDYKTTKHFCIGWERLKYIYIYTFVNMIKYFNQME